MFLGHIIVGNISAEVEKNDITRAVRFFVENQSNKDVTMIFAIGDVLPRTTVTVSRNTTRRNLGISVIDPLADVRDDAITIEIAP